MKITVIECYNYPCWKYGILRSNFLSKLLNLEIRDIHFKISFLLSKLKNVEKMLSSMLPRELLGNFYDSNTNKIHKYNLRCKTKLVNKFEKIRLAQNTDFNSFFKVDNSKWIINNCSKNIPKRVSRFLSLGEKFALPLDFKDNRDRLDVSFAIIKNFEACSHVIPEKVVDKVRSSVVNSVKKSLYSNKHVNHMDSALQKEYINCKNFLKNNDDIFVTKADKGQVTVIMDKTDYIKQMEDILKDDSTYKMLKSNPLRKITCKLDAMIRTWFEAKIIDEWQYRRLKCTNGNLPRCYGLPKIHKPGHPLRIIVSSLGSPLYEVAKFLNELLSTSLKKPQSHIKDCWSFVNEIKRSKIDSNDILVSLDVTSLFTNIPKELVIRAIEDRWEFIQKNTKLSLSQFIYAIDLVLCSTGFVFNDRYYEQIYGSPMGSPLSPILADLVMDDLETFCISRLDFSVQVFYRYVDDIFVIIPKTKLDPVLKSFNGYHPRLKFTCEIENNNMLNFLNTTVIRTDNGKLLTNWYRKPTFSGRYINFHSSHPFIHKLNTIKNLVDHAVLLSDEQFHRTNLSIVQTILENNSYPSHIIVNEIDKRYKILKNNKFLIISDRISDNRLNKMKTVTFPYVRNLSEDIKSILRNMIDVSFTIPKKLDTVIRKGKDRIDVKRVTQVVYKIDCINCDMAYIGQTKRHVATRINEHKNNIKNSTGNFSVVTEHRLNFNHDFDWLKPIILHKERNRKKREIAEMFFIKKFDNNINLQKDTENLNSIYDSIIIT